ncbi:Glu/Leu/Phe/Val dehydrogenase [Candidatus Woesebacteria bacterium]|nr:Glu/Leu/Phe/Val dehydrogenase [Candidatus Woesebacteria bacterium]
MLSSARTLIQDTGIRMGLTEDVIAQIIQPERVLEFSLPLRMDDGSVRMLQSFRSQHSSLRGPYKGGIRFHPGVTREEVIALSTLMSIKCAVANIPLGGGKGGIVVDPKKLSKNELERMSRLYASRLAPFMGESLDIPAPDVNTNGQIMQWMLDEYEGMKGRKEPAAFTGKNVDNGGSLGREQATGYGGVIALQELLKHLQTDKQKPLTIAIQGFGNVGYFFAEAAAEKGHTIVAVSDSQGGICVNVLDSIDVPLVLEYKRKQGRIAGCLGKTITNEELLTLPVDVLVPAALESVITKENMNQIQAKIIVEMANGPVSEEARAHLSHKGVHIIPDVLANSGGVIVSYLEWVQGKQGYWWSYEDVMGKLETLMQQAFSDMWIRSQEEKIDMKEAAFEVALQRIAAKI